MPAVHMASKGMLCAPLPPAPSTPWPNPGTPSAHTGCVAHSGRMDLGKRQLRPWKQAQASRAQNYRVLGIQMWPTRQMPAPGGSVSAPQTLWPLQRVMARGQTGLGPLEGGTAQSPGHLASRQCHAPRWHHGPKSVT